MLNSIQIHLDQEGACYLPGASLTGAIIWTLDPQIKEIAIRLFYYTEGKGSEDNETLEEVMIETPSQTGEAAFSFDLPMSPFSFQGELITLQWALEAVSQPKHICIERCPIILSPTQGTILLPRLKDIKTGKKKRSWSK